MSKQWNASGTTFEQAPLGAHTAICIRVIDLGTQESEYKGEKNVRRQNLITWELPDELRDDGQPYVISKFYTSSLGEKANLFKDLTSWFGRTPQIPFDPKSLIGLGCQVIITDRNDKHVVNAVVSLPKKEKIGKPVNETIFFSLDEDEYDENVFNKLPDGIKKMIMKSPEFANLMNGGSEDDDDVEEAF